MDTFEASEKKMISNFAVGNVKSVLFTSLVSQATPNYICMRVLRILATICQI